jgi:2-polyprenyl-3-methyl-5-hydroxy-6-metoxy-1,4-benzoquinol methylase
VQLDVAIGLIRSAVDGRDGVWADLGAGRGTFTRALASVLGPASRIHVVDTDARAIAEVDAWAKESASNVAVMQADFTGAITLPALDGMLIANALHFVKEQGSVLARLVKLLRPGGRVVLVEYDRRSASRWVPYPIPIAGLAALAKAAGLGAFTVAESRPSNYEGIIYTAFAEKPAAP